MRVLGFGDNIVDRFVDRGIDYPGGNCVNVAVFARRLGADAAYLGVFGDDGLGRFLRDAVAEQGVDVSRSVFRSGPSGISTLRVDDGERVFLGWNGGGITVSSPLGLDGSLLDYVDSFDLVHTSVYSRSEAELPALAARSALVSMDLSSEDEFRTAEYLQRTCPHADLVLLSCSHLTVQETRDLLARAIASGAGMALGTRGVDGSIVTDGVVTIEGAAHLVDADGGMVDTMGCGDAFLAGFVVSLLGAGWRKGDALDPIALEAALAAGADAAYEQCFVEGAFGGGRAFGDAVAASMW
ncbi:MAG: PfkB family carbohydrate kinase [Leifsonia sp.]